MPASPQTEGLSGSRRILVVDDNADAAESLAMLLSLDGHLTETASDGKSALEAARSFAPELIFLDIGLPGMNGYEVARLLRDQGGLADARFIALSGHGSADDKLRSRQAGFVCHILKPLDPGELGAIVARALGPLPA
ncbi:MAG: response regulator [Betaproteobacteria bacterium]